MKGKRGSGQERCDTEGNVLPTQGQRFYWYAIGSYDIAIFFYWRSINWHLKFIWAYKVIDPNSQNPYRFLLVCHRLLWHSHIFSLEV